MEDSLCGSGMLLVAERDTSREKGCVRGPKHCANDLGCISHLFPDLNRYRSHDTEGFGGLRRCVELAIGVRDLTGIAGSSAQSSGDGFGIESGSATEKPVASG
jgi:hypothetical protein